MWRADTIKEGLSAAGSAVGGAAGKVVDVTKSAVVATGEGISNVAHKAGDVVGRAPSPHPSLIHIYSISLPQDIQGDLKVIPCA